MSLFQCTECGKQVSTLAAACPSCGAPVPPMLKHASNAGPMGAASNARTTSPPPASGTLKPESAPKPFFGVKKWMVGSAVAVSGVVLVLFGMGATSSTPPPSITAASPVKTPVVHAAPKPNPEVEACKAKHVAMRGEYDALIQKKDYWAASVVVRRCATLTGEPELKQMLAEAELNDYWKTVRDRSLSARERQLALEKLERDFPAEAKEQEAALKQIAAQLQKDVAALEKKEAAQLAAEKRRQGVRIGMTREDVLASSWGKPESINRTTRSYGVHEQWVYGGRNYLYFENGVLTSIQN